MSSGPGTELARIFARLGIHGDCTPCRALADEMDRRGPDWCAENGDFILHHLERQARRRGLPFLRPAAAILVRLAIRRARRIRGDTSTRPHPPAGDRS
jgi:hypothetical protein